MIKAATSVISYLAFVAVLFSIKTFSEVAAKPHLEPGEAIWKTPSSEINFLQFTDAAHGWMIANERVYRSKDGGASWASSALPESVTPGFFAMSDSSVGLLADRRRLYRTKDGGVRWNLMKPFSKEEDTRFEIAGAMCVAPSGFPCIAFGAEYRNSSEVAPSYARDTQNLEHPRIARPVLYSASRADADWKKSDAELTGFIVKSLHFFSEKDAALLTDVSAFWTDDGGVHWLKSRFEGRRSAKPPLGYAPVESGLIASAWQNPSRGWGSYGTGDVFGTDDMGRTWRPLCNLGGDAAWIVSMIKGGAGVAVMSSKTIEETFDGGRSWLVVRQPRRKPWTVLDTDKTVAAFALDLEHVWYCSPYELFRTRFGK